MLQENAFDLGVDLGVAIGRQQWRSNGRQQWRSGGGGRQGEAMVGSNGEAMVDLGEAIDTVAIALMEAATGTTTVMAEGQCR